MDIVRSDNMHRLGLQYNAIMNTTNDDLGRKIAIPSYIFITLLLTFLGGMAVRTLWLADVKVPAMLSAGVILVQVGLYWINFFRADNNRQWSFIYYPLQTALMLGTALLLISSNADGVSFLFSATICIVGEALGVWGNSRRSMLIGIFYISLLVVTLFLLLERADFYAVVAGLAFNGGAILFLIIMFNQQLAERQKAMELAESLESANAKLAAYNAKIESLTLQNERQRMARELHDTLAQGVAGLVLQLEAVKAHLKADRPKRAVAIVEQSITRARSTLAESRAAIDDLRAVPINLADAVREQVEHFKQSTGLPCELDISIAENQLPVETTNHALNILSESLTNIARHAEATKVKVNFFIQKQTLELEVRDNGKGFDEKQESKGHYGLVGMHERARLTGGMLSIESDANGTCVQFIVGGES